MIKIQHILPFSISIVIILIYSMYHRALNGDEAIIAEHAYWLSKDGIVKSKLFTGIDIGWEDRFFLYHKLLVYLGAIVISILGISIFNLKLIILFSFLLFSIFLHKYYNQNNISHKKLSIYPILSITLLLINAKFFEWSFTYRPETMVMTFGFIGFYYLSKFINKQKYIHLILCTTFNTLAFLSHLNGIIFIIASGLFLLIKKDYKSTLVYSLIGGILSLSYFLDFQSWSDFETLLFQFQNDPNITKNEPSIFSPLLKILNEQQRYFHSPKEFSFTILFLLSLFFGFKYFKKEQRDVLYYLILIALLLSVLTHGKTSKYALIVFPYFAIIITNHLLLINKHIRWKKIVTHIALAFFILVQGYYIFKLVSIKSNPEERHQLIAQHIKKGSQVMAPVGFIFNEIEHYHITSPSPLWFREHYKSHHSKLNYFFDFALENGNDHIVIDFTYYNKFINELFTFSDFHKDEIYGAYKVSYIGDHFVILSKP